MCVLLPSPGTRLRIRKGREGWWFPGAGTGFAKTRPRLASAERPDKGHRGERRRVPHRWLVRVRAGSRAWSVIFTRHAGIPYAGRPVRERRAFLHAAAGGSWLGWLAVNCLLTYLVTGREERSESRRRTGETGKGSLLRVDRSGSKLASGPAGQQARQVDPRVEIHPHNR